MPALGNRFTGFSFGQGGWRVLAILVIVALLANWTWVLLAPRGDSVLPAMPPASTDAAEQLFGHAVVTAVTVQAVMPNLRLVGVFAGKPGFAVLEIDGKRQLSVQAGKQIEAGATLVEVAADYVVIELNGVRQRIPLEGNSTAIKSAEAATVASIPMPVSVVQDANASNSSVQPNVGQVIQPRMR